MKKRNPRIVKHQKTRVIQTNKDYSGESSPYLDWLDSQGIDEDGDRREPAQANPDILSADSRTPLTQSLPISVGDISRQLSGQQKKVFELYVQEGLKEREIASILGITPGTVHTYLDRIRQKFKYYV